MRVYPNVRDWYLDDSRRRWDDTVYIGHILRLGCIDNVKYENGHELACT